GPRGGERGGADQDRQRQPHRPGGQVQPAAPHRRGAGGHRPLSGAGSLFAVGPTRWAALIVGGLALVFAGEAGEYSTWDWWQVHRQEREERATVATLSKTVDSLTQVLHLVETDPATQERIAREQFGMLRKGEFLYRIVPDTNGER